MATSCARTTVGASMVVVAAQICLILHPSYGRSICAIAELHVEYIPPGSSIEFFMFFREVAPEPQTQPLPLMCHSRVRWVRRELRMAG